MSSLSLGGAGTRAGGLGNGRFQLGNVGVDTENRLGEVRGVRAGISKIETRGAASGITLAQDAGRGRESTDLMHR